MNVPNLEHIVPKIVALRSGFTHIGFMLMESKTPQEFLVAELAKRKRMNPAYSLRAFARQLKLSPGELSEIMSGKRHLSLKSALRTSKALGLNQIETKQLLQIAQLDKSADIADKDLLSPLASQRIVQQISNDLFHIVSDWFCFAIINLADCKQFKWNVNFISQKLGISALEARLGLERLERVGLIEMRNGKKRIAKDYVMTSSGIPSEAIRNYHRQMLKKAQEALDFQAVDEREIRGLGLPVDPKQLPAIKNDLKNFLDDMAAKYSKGEKSEVYHLELAFFRLTKPDPLENK